MAEKALGMMRQGLEAYSNEDVELAQNLAGQDDEVDRLYNQVVRILLVIMTQKRSIRSRYLLKICRSLSRTFF